MFVKGSQLLTKVKMEGTNTNKHTYTQHADLINLLFCLKLRKKSEKKINKTVSKAYIND